MDDSQLRPKDKESHPRDQGKHLICIDKTCELPSKKAESTCLWGKTGLALNAKHIVSCYRKVSGENNAHHDIIVNIHLNNICCKRGLIAHKQNWESRDEVLFQVRDLTMS